VALPPIPSRIAGDMARLGIVIGGKR
jgi:hypothetical protein